MWHLAMNLNPNDGHTMDYCTAWHEDIQLGEIRDAFRRDYISKDVRHLPVNYIAICRHDNGKAHALKVWRFKESNRSLLSRFQAMDPGRVHATDNEMYSHITKNEYLYDPIFSETGALVFNWIFAGNGVRIASSGTHLSDVDVDDDSTHGLGGNFAVSNPRKCKQLNRDWGFEVGISNTHHVMGKDHGEGFPKKTKAPWSAYYAIFVSTEGFPFNMNSPFRVNMSAIRPSK